MPTYDYKCETCELVFEQFHKMNEKPEVVCPECGANAIKQISLSSGIIFKGSGFYINDYKKPEKKEKSSEIKSADTKPESIKKPDNTKKTDPPKETVSQKSVPKEK